MKKLITTLAIATLLSTSIAVANNEDKKDLAQENNLVPNPIEQKIENSTSGDDIEHENHSDIFLNNGYQGLKWIQNDKLATKIYEDLVLPDWERRNNKKNTSGGGMDFAQAYITQRGFNDIVTVSRLPGDCDSSGCLYQVYSLIGQQWFKQLEFKAYNFVFKHGKIDGESMVVAVGDDEHPSTLHFWDGSKFIK